MSKSYSKPLICDDFNFYFSVTRASATQIAWRDWGRQRRVVPHPNLASKQVCVRMMVANTSVVRLRIVDVLQVTDAHAAALAPFAQTVAKWYDHNHFITTFAHRIIQNITMITFIK